MSTPADPDDSEPDHFSVRDAWWGAAMVDPNGVVVDANEAFADVVGLPLEDIVGHGVDQVFGHDQLGIEMSVARRLRSGDGPVIEYRRSVERPGGDRWDGVVRMSLLRDPDGKPEMFHVRFNEPGSRRPPERIAWREGDFPLALDAMKVGVAIIGLDGTLLQANRALTEITGRTEEELRATDLLAMTHPDDRVPDVELGTRAWLGEIDSYTIEKRLVRPDESVVWVRQEVAFARDEIGQPVHLVGQVIDIGDLKEVEFELVESRQELADLIDQMPVGLLSSGPDGLIVTANRAAADIAGVEEMPAGTDITGMIHPDDINRIVAITMERALAGNDYHLEFRVVRPDGTVRWVRNDARPELAPDGSLLRIRGTWLDITELKSAEELLRRQATRDPLTGLANRRVVFAALAASIERCASGVAHLSVLFVDLDGFKAVNDSLGHGAGDRVLVDAAQRIETVAAQAAVVARIGGDEFIVASERQGAPEARSVEKMADQIIASVGMPYDLNHGQVELGASIGIATWVPGMTADDLVNAADRAVYRAKRAGRNCWRYA